MAKIKLVAEPTYKETVEIPVPGGEVSEIEVTFKHRTRDDMKAFVDKAKDMTDPDLVQAVVAGWDLDEPFNDANVKTLLQNYHGAAGAIWHKYVTSLAGYRAKS